MTDERTTDIHTDELDWAGAEVHEGQQAAVVISVRFGARDAARLRAHAEHSGLTVSDIIRKALAEYEATPRKTAERRAFVTAFTYGGTVPVVYESSWQWSGFEQTNFVGSSMNATVVAPTSTEPTRVQERVTVEA